VGGQLGLDAGSDGVQLTVSIPKAHLGVAVDVIADVIQRPAFEAKEVSAAKRRQLAGMANELDEPSSLADRAVTQALWDGTPYAHPLSGWMRSVEKFSQAKVKAWHAARFGPASARLYAVGDVDPSEVEALATKFFGKWKSSAAVAEPVVKVPALTGRRVLLVDKADSTQTQLRVATMGFSRGHADTFPAVVAAGVLGGGFTSRLMEEIRVNRGLSYGANAGFYGYRSGGEFNMSTFTDTEKTAEAIEVMLHTCRKFVEDGPTAEELARTQTYMAGLYPMQLETNEQWARTFADTHRFGLGDEWVTQYRARVAAVTLEQAREVSKKYMPIDSYLLVAVGKAAKIRKSLEAFGKVEVIEGKTLL
jgi:zinc protease